MTHAPVHTLTAAETARLLHRMGFNWLDVEFVLEFAPHSLHEGHMRYRSADLQRFVSRAFWLSEHPFDASIQLAA
ncbi:MAG: hypothetical protein RLO08_11385 [Parvibaculaceae bacterium]